MAVLDETGTLGPPVEAALRAARFGDKPRFVVQPAGRTAVEAGEAALKKAVLEGGLDGYLQLPADALATRHGRATTARTSAT